MCGSRRTYRRGRAETFVWVLASGAGESVLGFAVQLVVSREEVDVSGSECNGGEDA
jgi:hypothetical protein